MSTSSSGVPLSPNTKRKVTLRQAIENRERRKTNVVHGISSQAALTLRQLENFLNSQLYSDIIISVLEERYAEEKCGCLLCPESARSKTTSKLKSPYQIRGTRVFSNEQRRKYCSEICFNRWLSIEKDFKHFDNQRQSGKLKRLRLRDFSFYASFKSEKPVDADVVEQDEIILLEKLTLDDNEDVIGQSDDDIEVNGPAKIKTELDDIYRSRLISSRRKNDVTSMLQIEIQVEELYTSWLQKKSRKSPAKPPAEIEEADIAKEEPENPAMLTPNIPQLPNVDSLQSFNVRAKTLASNLFKIVKTTDKFRKTGADGHGQNYVKLIHSLIQKHFTLHAKTIMISAKLKQHMALVLGTLLSLVDDDADSNEIGRYLDVESLNQVELEYCRRTETKLRALLTKQQGRANKKQQEPRRIPKEILDSDDEPDDIYGKEVCAEDQLSDSEDSTDDDDCAQNVYTDMIFDMSELNKLF